MSRPQILISLLVLAILGLHGLAAAGKALTGPSSLWGDRSWPFLAYGMYRFSHPPGPIQATKQSIVALSASGEEVEIEPQLVGVNSQALAQHYLGPMRAGDSRAASRLAERMNAAREDPIVAFRLERHTYTISDSGVVLEDSQSTTYLVDR